MKNTYTEPKFEVVMISDVIATSNPPIPGTDGSSNTPIINNP